MIGKQIQEGIFRDTTNFYKTSTDSVAMSLIKFTQEYAGKTILDFGCATGNYCVHLSRLGYTVKGVDVNAEYIKIAREKGVEAQLIKGKVPFMDKSFDTVIVFEVLEHLAKPEKVIAEAKRLAQKNVLFTVPNCGDVKTLRNHGLIFEHFSDLDHKNFFTKESLQNLLKIFFSDVQVWRGDEIDPVALIDNVSLRFMGKVLKKLGLIRPRFFFRLFAVATSK